MNKQILVSGIKPTGETHIGNYLGALKRWVELQDQFQCYYFVADLHALTIDYDPKSYQDKVKEMYLDLLAIGLDPKKCTIFTQSHIPEHTELTWLFNTLTPVAELERMTQYKDQVRQNAKNINAGLFDYPVLQAADILIYKAVAVPVGEDQLQHLELTNLIVRKFNNKFGQFFQEIKPIPSKATRVMSLADPTKKMSKSLGASHYISLNDSPEIIRKKVMSAMTDTGPTGSSEMSAGVKNIFTLLEEFANAKIVSQYKNAYIGKSLKYAELKAELAEAIIKTLAPIKENKAKLMKDPKKIQKIMDEGDKRARTISQKNLLEIKKIIGLI